MANRLSKLGVLALAGLLVALPATAQINKQATWDQLVSIAQQISELKTNPANAAEVQQLLAQYEDLSALLGGDDPGGLLASGTPGGTASALGGGTTPPSCNDTSQNFASADTPLAINDNLTTTSTIVVSGLPAYTTDVDVITDIAHTFAADLEMTVTSPAGTQVTISTDNGGGNDDVFAGTQFDDDGGDSNPPGAATDNMYDNLVTETPLVAEEAMGAFIGEDPNGTWQIDIFDDAGADTGTLNGWSITVVAVDSDPIFGMPSAAVSTDTPLAINDNLTTTSTITVSGADDFACDVNIMTDIQHTFAADLEITVTSPAGTQVTITTDNGGGNDDVFAGTLWDDSAGSSNAPGPVTDNMFDNLVTETPLVVEEALAAFIGEDPNGTWQIDVFDDAGADTGTLNSWSVEVVGCSCDPAGPPAVEIPTLQPTALTLLFLLLAAAGFVVLMRRKRTV